MQVIYSQGWAYRQAATGRSTPIAFWGMWLIFAPAVLLMVGQYIDVARYGFEAADLPGLALTAVFALLYAAVLYRVTRNYVRHRRYRTGHCGVCRYSLRGLTEPRCPECGTAFDPEFLDSDGGDPLEQPSDTP
jgi:hypothetical protein